MVEVHVQNDCKYRNSKNIHIDISDDRYQISTNLYVNINDKGGWVGAKVFHKWQKCPIKTWVIFFNRMG